VLTHLTVCSWTGPDLLSDRLAARHEGIVHHREIRHGAFPKQTLGASTDPADVDIDDYIALSGRCQID